MYGELINELGLKIQELEKKNSKIVEAFKKIISYHIGTIAPLGFKQLIKFLQEILNDLEK